MDSVTQAVLGAAIGEALLGRKLGARGAAWGLLLGTLPDLDVVLSPMLDDVQELMLHRGPSHGVIILAVLTPVFAWLLMRMNRPVGYGRMLAFVGLALGTHVLIDCFNVYGTQLLWPISKQPFGMGNLFIIDPLFTLPLLIGLIVAIRLKQTSRARLVVICIALGLSSLYVGASFAAKAKATSIMASQLAEIGVLPDPLTNRYNLESGEEPATLPRWQVAATPFNILYWRAIAEQVSEDGVDGYWIGYVSLLDDPDQSVTFHYVPRNDRLLGGRADGRAMDALRWFSHDFYGVRKVDDQLVVSDLRFGETTLGQEPPAINGPSPFMFNFRLSDDGRTFNAVPSAEADWKSSLAFLWHRLRGRPADAFSPR